MVPEAGLEPARSRAPRDFKSLASTNSATPAWSASKTCRCPSNTPSRQGLRNERKGTTTERSLRERRHSKSLASTNSATPAWRASKTCRHLSNTPSRQGLRNERKGTTTKRSLRERRHSKSLASTNSATPAWSASKAQNSRVGESTLGFPLPVSALPGSRIFLKNTRLRSFIYYHKAFRRVNA